MTAKKTHEQYVKEIEGTGIKVLETYISSNDKIKHMCECGKEWYVSPSKVLLGRKCGCRKKFIRLINNEEYILKLSEKSIKVVPLEDYKGTNTKIKHKCECGNVWDVTPDSVLHGRKCGCNRLGLIRNPRKKHEDYVLELSEKRIKTIPLEEYRTARRKIQHRCECGNVWNVQPAHVLRGAHCGCNKGGKMPQEEYITLLETKKINIRPIETYKGYDIPFKHKCICGNEWNVTPTNVLRGQTCGCGRFKTHEEYLKKLKSRKIKVTPIEKYEGIETKIMHRCICGKEWSTYPKYVLLGVLCGCTKSYGEMIIDSWCKENKIKVEREVSFSDLISPKGRKLRYDFAIYKEGQLFCLIEYHGKQHFEITNPKWRKSIKDFKYSLKRDRMKKEYAKNKGIPLIEITYKDKDICKKIEIELFNLGYFDLFNAII